MSLYSTIYPFQKTTEKFHGRNSVTFIPPLTAGWPIKPLQWFRLFPTWHQMLNFRLWKRSKYCVLLSGNRLFGTMENKIHFPLHCASIRNTIKIKNPIVMLHKKWQLNIYKAFITLNKCQKIIFPLDFCLEIFNIKCLTSLKSRYQQGCV